MFITPWWIFLMTFFGLWLFEGLFNMQNIFVMQILYKKKWNFLSSVYGGFNCIFCSFCCQLFGPPSIACPLCSLVLSDIVCRHLIPIFIATRTDTGLGFCFFHFPFHFCIYICHNARPFIRNPSLPNGFPCTPLYYGCCFYKIETYSSSNDLFYCITNVNAWSSIKLPTVCGLSESVFINKYMFIQI